MRQRKIVVPEETWAAMRMEYISTDISLRGMEKKYGIPFNQIRNRCGSEKWVEKREGLKNETVQKSIDLISDFNADECTKAFRIANKAMDKIEQCIDGISAKSPRAPQDMKSITSAIRDLKEIGVFRNRLDREEQEARIRKLRRDSGEEQEDSRVTVEIEGGDEYTG